MLSTTNDNPRVCIVPGYGVPSNDRQKLELNLYIKKVREALGTITCPILLSGGSTALEQPYERTEAGALHDAWGSTKNRIIIEDKAISILENILFSRDKLHELDISSGVLWIFVENIRKERIEIITKLVLSDYRVKLVPVDLGHQSDNSAKEGERIATEWIKWALARSENMAWYHEVFAEKILAARRSYVSTEKFNTVDWWQTKWEEIKIRLKSDGYNV